MPYYLVRVADDAGRLATHSLLAGSPQDCRRHYEAEGLHVVSVRRDWKELRTSGITIGRRVKGRDFILFNQEFVALIRAGYPILRSLEVISGRVKNVHLKEMLQQVEQDVRSGKALSEAFLPFERDFGKVYIASLLAGERSGNLPGVLGRYIQYSKVIDQTRSRVRSAMAYPTVLLAFSFILLGILVNFILPKFEGFYRDFEAQMPLVSQALMSAALWFRSHYLHLLLALGVAVIVYLRMMRSEANRAKLDARRLHIPLLRDVWVESGLAQFSRTLSLLLEAGITLLNGVGIANQAVPNRHMRARLAPLADGIRNGGTLSDGLTEAGVFPPLAVDMVRIGETSANLQGLLAEVADYYDEKVRGRIDTLVSLVEPIIIIFMGAAIAGMLLSVYLPIFNIIRVMR